MAKFDIDDERKYYTPLTLYMDYILLNYNRFLKSKLENVNITNREYMYLFNIFYIREISQKELADFLYVSEANIAKVIRKLEQKGYVERRKDENHRSRNIVSLTKKGELLVKRMYDMTIEWESNVCRPYDTEKVDKFKDFLFDVSENSVDE